MMTTIELTGTETDEQLKQTAFEMLALAHPVEAHEHDPEKFWQFFQRQCPDCPRGRMEKMLNEMKSQAEHDPAE